jgi:hypothetical protein
MMRRVVQVALASILISACGGGGGGGDSVPPPPAGTAEGLWDGTTDSGRAVSGLVLDDDTYWFIYSVEGNSEVIAGVVQGQGSSNNGSFTSSNARDFNFEGLGINDATIQGNYAQKSSLDGTTSYPALSDTVIFNLDYDASYEQSPSLSTNVYDVSITFQGGSCANGTSTVSGVAYLDSETNTVYSAALNGSRTNGFLFIGTKP